MLILYTKMIEVFFFFLAEDCIRDGHVTGVQTCALPISDDDPELLQYFASHGVAHGTQIELAKGAPFSDTVTLVAPEAQLTLGPAAVDAVWVTPTHK